MCDSVALNFELKNGKSSQVKIDQQLLVINMSSIVFSVSLLPIQVAPDSHLETDQRLVLVQVWELARSQWKMIPNFWRVKLWSSAD